MQRKQPSNASSIAGSESILKSPQNVKPKLIEEVIAHQTKANPNTGSYCHEFKFWLTRIIFLRSLCFVYLIAFLVSLQQNPALIGENGLTPAISYMKKLRQNFGTDTYSFEAFLQTPSVFWLIEPTSNNLSLVAGTGALISSVVVLLGSANVPMLLSLWILYMSIVNIGQTWFSFGWESQLLETGFLAIFMVPLISLSRFPSLVPTPFVVVWGYRWLLFRIMLGAGLIKLRGDVCWKDLTCMMYFYETQPVPNPLSPLFHSSPELIHTIETFGNHIIELVIPWLMFLPRTFRITCGIINICFQLVLILAGNLSFLNWLTMVAAIMYLDDAALLFLFPKDIITEAISAENRYDDARKSHRLSVRIFIYLHRFVSLALSILLLCLSVPVVLNLLSPRQSMNTSFDSFRIVNTYGAFGSVTKERSEVVLEGTSDIVLKTDTVWKEYNFKCKPGNIDRRPCFISPWHYRLDWLLWFAAFQDYQQCPWLVHIGIKLLRKDELVLSLLAPDGNPFGIASVGNGTAATYPTYIRAMHYAYEYNAWQIDTASPTRQREKAKENLNTIQKTSDWTEGLWWKRRLLREYMPPISLDDKATQIFIRHYGWDGHESSSGKI